MPVAEDIEEQNKPESRSFEAQPFQADVAKLLQLMVHSVYSDKSVFLRELIANAADACERLRYEAIADPALLGEDIKPRINIALDAEGKQLTVEDNGIGMSRDEMIEALGTIARSGTKAFLERIETAQNSDSSEESALIGRFGVGFYSVFMVADRVEVISRRAGTDAAWLWSSDGKGAFAVSPAGPLPNPPPLAGEGRVGAPRRGTRVVLHLMDDAKTYAERSTIERLVKAQSGHVPVPIAIADKPGAEPTESPTARRFGPSPKPISRRRITPISTAAWAGCSTTRRLPSISAPRDGRITPRSSSYPVRGLSICSTPIAPGASSSMSGASLSPTTRRSCRAICALFAGWSTVLTCR